jgi:Concanavalin A-like lectin/glucanases superfamily/Ig-like domain CHU_C associated
MKNFTIIGTIFFLLSFQVSYSQQVKYDLLGSAPGYDSLMVYSSEGNLGNAGSYAGTFATTADINQNAGIIQPTFASTPIAKLLKASAGKPFDVTLSFKIYSPLGNTVTVNNDGNTITGAIGKNEQNNVYDQNVVLNYSGGGYDANTQSVGITFSNRFTFPVGRTQGWLVFQFSVSRTSGPINSTKEYTIALPYVVEGASILITQANPVAKRGYLKEPSIPQMILHNPPGDLSTVTFQTNQEACRNMSESLTTDESNTGKLGVTLGIAGSAGLFITTNFEFSVTASASVGGGSTSMRSSGRQNCVSILNAITTAAGSAPANQGSIYLGYSSDIAYGVFPNVFINTFPTLSVEKDSSLIFGVEPNSATPFYYNKGDILNDIAQRQAIIDNPTTLPRIRHEAQSQIKIWRQVLEKDSININNPSAEVIRPPFTMTGKSVAITNSVTQSVATSDTYDVSHFIEASAGISFIVKFGGSGVDGGYEFKTKKTMGTSVTNTLNNSTTVAYTLADNTQGDILRIKIIKDRTYGTPIFLLDSAQSKTSWPYEGGYPRDQPSLRFKASPTSSTYTVPNVPVSTPSLPSPSIFAINLCNNSNEQRTYNLRFKPITNGNDATIRITGSFGTTEFGDFTINPSSCAPLDYFVNVTQPNAAALSSADLNLQLYALNDQAVAANIFATCNWGNYALPTGISTGQTSICQGANANVSLTANCAAGTVASWYNTATLGNPIGTGSPFLQSPTVNTNYFVSCNSGIYNYKRFASNAVIVNPSPTAPMLTASGPLAFCSPGSVTLKSYSGTNNNVMNFVRTNSQYIAVPHSPSLNLAGTFTMEAWVNYSGSNLTILDKGNYNYLWSLNANNNGNKMGFYTRGTGAWVYSTVAVPQNTWTHVAITLNAGTLTFYINGVASGTAAVTFSQDNKAMNIGRQQPTFCVCNHFNGGMDELRLWNVVRTPAQIQANMNSGVSANSAGLVAYYKFNESSGNLTIDETSNRNSGILTNGPTRQMLQTVPFNESNPLWTPSNTNVSSIIATNSGTYTASLTNSFGCTNSASLVVNALASPMPTPQATAYIPTGGGVSLTATGCSGGLGTYGLKWYKASDNTLATMPVSPTTTTNYYAKCEQTLNSIICVSLASANVSVNVGNVVNSFISGNWESTNTWTPSRVPLPTDVVIINNHTVTITSNAANAKSLEYKSGATLKYLNAAAKLNVGF